MAGAADSTSPALAGAARRRPARYATRLGRAGGRSRSARTVAMAAHPPGLRRPRGRHRRAGRGAAGTPRPARRPGRGARRRSRPGHEALHWLDLQGLLHGASTPLHGQLRRNAYGRVPGEGAAAIALGASVQLAPASWARLLGCATALEPVTHTSPRPCTGLGLTQAARQAIEQARTHSPAPVGQLIADLNGEPYRADQFGFAALRLGRAFTPDWQRSVPALASGDLHSASALAHVALAAYGQWRRPQGTHILVLASSDDTLRGAAVLGASQPTRNLPEIRAWRSPSTSTA